MRRSQNLLLFPIVLKRYSRVRTEKLSEHLKLENQLCFRLYRLNKTITKLYAPLLKSLGLTYPQYLTMLVLWQHNQGVTVKSLGEALDLDTGTLSPMLKRMERLDLIKRTRSKEDERVVTIELTAHGKHIKTKAKNIPGQMLSMTKLSINEIKALQQSLDHLQTAISEHIK